jgi:hypothetical protein
VPRHRCSHEDDLPVVESHRQHVAVVAEVDVEIPRARLGLARQVWQQVETVDVVLVGAADRLMALLQLVDDVGIAGHREERRQPVVMLDDAVGDRTGGDLPRPPHEQRHAEGALPVRVFLAAERRHPAVGP